MYYNLLILLFIALLLFITVEDFRFRAVSWWVFPLLGVMSIVINATVPDFVSILINLGFIAIQFLSLTIYFSIKQKKIINITEEYLGWGDVLLWIALSFLFSPLNFFSFYFISMFLSFIAAMVIRIIKKEEYSIPLAGIQAIVLVFAIVINFIFHITTFQDDRLIENIIIG